MEIFLLLFPHHQRRAFAVFVFMSFFSLPLSPLPFPSPYLPLPSVSLLPILLAYFFYYYCRKVTNEI